MTAYLHHHQQQILTLIKATVAFAAFLKPNMFSSEYNGENLRLKVLKYRNEQTMYNVVQDKGINLLTGIAII